MSARIMSFFARRPAAFFCTTFLGNSISLICFIYFFFQVLLPSPHAVLNSPVSTIVLSFLLSVMIIYLVNYVLPKGLTIINATRFLQVSALPFALAYTILSPLVYLFLLLLRFITGWLKLDYSEDRPLFREQAQPALTLRKHIAHQTFDREILFNALDFKTIKIRDCMVPRTEITAVEVSETIARLRQIFTDSGHSKIIVFRKTIDDIIGYCHSSSLFKKPLTIADILTPIVTAPETTPANELMRRFIREDKTLAVVMDEFGGTAGIVSIEDIIEEIFGETENEPDTDDDLLEQKLDAYTYLFNARLEIDYLNKTYDLELPTGDYDTLGGLILSLSENMPAPGEVIEWPPFVFTIQTSQNNRIGLVKTTVSPAPGRTDLTKDPNP